VIARLSQRAFARLKGWNPGYVNKLVKRGVIVLDAEGLIDAAAADAAIAAAKDPGKAHMAAVNERQRAQARGLPPPPAADDEGDDEPAAAPSANATYHRAKTAREVYEARGAALDYQERVGKLVRADDVRRTAFEKARAMRDRLLSIPDRIAPVLAAESDIARVHDALAGEIKGALRELAQQGETASVPA
jgi:hypothetical protein